MRNSFHSIQSIASVCAFIWTLSVSTGPAIGGNVDGRAEVSETLNPREQLGVMLQLDNMLETMPHHVWGKRRGEIDREFALLQNAGVQWCRVGIPWQLIEAKPGHWEWGAADHVVECAQRHHVRLCWLVGDTAPWDSTNKDWNGVPRDIHNPNGHFSNFVRKLVERYKGRVEHWEIRNEPNLDYMWHGNEKQYVAYLAAAHRVIKHQDPQAQVVLGGLGGGLSGQLKYFRNLISECRKQQSDGLPFDIADFHVYAAEADNNGYKGPGCVEKYLSACRRQIDSLMETLDLAQMPVWFTEFDYPATPQQQPDPELKGPEGQAKVVGQLFGKLVEGKPHRKIFWASLLDDYNDPGFHSIGLVVSDKQYHIKKERPAYFALKQVLLGGAQP